MSRRAFPSSHEERTERKLTESDRTGRHVGSVLRAHTTRGGEIGVSEREDSVGALLGGCEKQVYKHCPTVGRIKSEKRGVKSERWNPHTRRWLERALVFLCIWIYITAASARNVLIGVFHCLHQLPGDPSIGLHTHPGLKQLGISHAASLPSTTASRRFESASVVPGPRAGNHTWM